ncbi:MAG: ATP-binding cassette domain-containing protein, partial [bacterium]
QESFLFSDTIASNLAYGDLTHPLVERESVDEERIQESRASGAHDAAAHTWAADVAQLGDTVQAFPHGYGTMLGERGINLSGGQKQRLALARALARRPRIVLLDDALSAVDTHTEAEILRGLRATLMGRTAVIASHRVSAVRDASWIIVLDGGRVVEEGTHDVLITAGGQYAALLSRQQLEESLEETDGAAGQGTGDLVGAR